MLCERDRSGYFETMARPGRTEPDSVSIWLKLSEEDAARMTQVLAQPEFAGWTRAEWCLEMIQTALRYYTRTRPAAEPVPEPEAAVPEAAVPEAAVPEPESEQVAPEPAVAEPAAAKPVQAAAEPPAQPECSHPADSRD